VIKPHGPNPTRAQQTVDTATSLLGTPYLDGGTNRQGTDCSGLVDQAIPDYFPNRMTAADQLQYMESKGDEDVPPSNLKPGDIVYFRDAKGKVSHAGVVEKVNPSSDRPTGIIAASSDKRHRFVRRGTLGKDGSFGKKLWYAGGGRPR
jgi:hypothetical protein